MRLIPTLKIRISKICIFLLVGCFMLCIKKDLNLSWMLTLCVVVTYFSWLGKLESCEVLNLSSYHSASRSDYRTGIVAL